MTARRIEGVLLALAAVAACRPEVHGGDGGPGPMSAAAVDTACVRIVSCSPPGSELVTDCTSEAFSRPAAGRRLTDEWLSCLDAAGSDCVAALACAPSVDPASCEGVDEGTSCVGDMLVSCWSGEVEAVTDCTAWGLACTTPQEGRADCQGSGASCLEGDERCERNVAVLCAGGREAEYDCAELADEHVCGLSAGHVVCAPVSRDCDPGASSDWCDGDDLVHCSTTGRVTRTSCTGLGFTACVQQGDRAVCSAEAE